MHRISTLKENVPPQPSHERHRPEKTLLYRIIDRYYPEFLAYMAEQGRSLPYHVQKEFDEYLKCGRLEHGFLRVQCSTCHHEQLVAFSCTNSRRHEANDAVSVPAAVPDACPKVQPCWLTKSFLINPYVNGY
jgi:hypothetical protein